MPRVLLTLGDSWPQGGELKLDYEFPYGILLQKKLGFDQLHNYGSAGASNEDSLYQLQSYLKTNSFGKTTSLTKSLDNDIIYLRAL